LIYLDNAATTNNKPKGVIKAVTSALKRPYNIGRSSGKEAFTAAEKVFAARRKICELLNTDTPENIIFTNNATMALNIALKGLTGGGGHVISTKTEHNSVLRQLYTNENITFSLLDCDRYGFVDLRNLERLIDENTRMRTHERVCVCVINAVSNVTGAIQDYKKIHAIAGKTGVHGRTGVHNKTGVPVLFDFSQAAGNINIDLKGMEKCAASFSGHKSLLGPQGTGVLYISPDLELATVIEGGTGSMSELLTQPEYPPDRFEAGTVNTPGILGLSAGVDFVLSKGIENIRAHKAGLIKILYNGLKKIPGIKIYHSGDFNRHTGILSFNIGRKIHSEEIALKLSEEYGITVRGGLHCAPLAHAAIGTAETGTVRVSVGYKTTKSEIKKFIKAVERIADCVSRETVINSN
jgi:cysteine desulfurase family protein